MNKIVICICICFYILCTPSYGGGGFSSTSDKNPKNDKKYITDELKKPKPNFNDIEQIIFKYDNNDIELLNNEIIRAIYFACKLDESEFLFNVLKKCIEAGNKNIFSSLFYLFDYACDHNDEELLKFIVFEFEYDNDIFNLTKNYNNLLKYAFFYKDIELINRILINIFKDINDKYELLCDLNSRYDSNCSLYCSLYCESDFLSVDIEVKKN